MTADAREEFISVKETVRIERWLPGCYTHKLCFQDYLPAIALLVAILSSSQSKYVVSQCLFRITTMFNTKLDLNARFSIWFFWKKTYQIARFTAWSAFSIRCLNWLYHTPKYTSTTLIYGAWTWKVRGPPAKRIVLSNRYQIRVLRAPPKYARKSCAQLASNLLQT